MADVQIVYACIDKKKLNEPYRNGNELYHQVLKEVIRRSMEVSQETDIDVVIDGSGFIKSEELMEIGKEISVSLEKNLKRCSKVSFNKCVRLADYIAGSLWAKYERENNEYFEMIKERISVACESLRPR